MSDKFLVDVPQETTYSSRRAKAQLAGQRRGQAHNARDAPLKEREEQRRREGLNRSLFDEEGDGEAPRGGLGSSTQGAGTSVPKPRDAGQAKAMDFMKKMGWSVGESLGKRRSASPERKNNDKQPKPAEPIRISMWAGTSSYHRPTELTPQAAKVLPHAHLPHHHCAGWARTTSRPRRTRASSVRATRFAAGGVPTFPPAIRSARRRGLGISSSTWTTRRASRWVTDCRVCT
jgi:hypothetical protein